MTPKKLVLFDIDGTLLWPDGAGRASMKAALEMVFGTAGALESYQFIGRTDRETVWKLMTEAGLTNAQIEERFSQIAPAMEAALSQFVADKQYNIRACPGGPELIAELALRDDTLVGLITGNVKPTAAIKLRAAGYDPTSFKIGAYGHLSADRVDLARHVVADARSMAGFHFDGQAIVIIGDTPSDITCGREVGARTIAVLTGWVERAEMEAYRPDYLLENLSDTQAVLSAIYS